MCVPAYEFESLYPLRFKQIKNRPTYIFTHAAYNKQHKSMCTYIKKCIR